MIRELNRNNPQVVSYLALLWGEQRGRLGASLTFKLTFKLSCFGCGQVILFAQLPWS